MLTALVYILYLNGFLGIYSEEHRAIGEAISKRDGAMSKSQISEASEQVIDVNEFLRNLPEHLSLLPHQAAGHPFNQENKTLGLLKDSRGYALKPVDKKTSNELNFYKEVKNGFHPDLAPLIPEFHGTVNVPFRNKTVEFIVLEDLAHGFEKPCVLDVKIGKRTWGPDASVEKINHEKGKYTSCKEHYGFSIPGFQLMDPVTNELKKFDRHYCRSLNPESLKSEVERFVHTTKDSRATAALLKRIIGELEQVWKWASTQTKLRLYASSIVILYDYQALKTMVPKINEENLPTNPLGFVRVKMIDFCHTHKAPDLEGIDTNYLNGVNALVKIFQDMLLKHSTAV